eukprot:jgi/Tetstr1/434878/TSEL_023875.t1
MAGTDEILATVRAKATAVSSLEWKRPWERDVEWISALLHGADAADICDYWTAADSQPGKKGKLQDKLRKQINGALSPRLCDELLRREAEYNVTAAAKAAVQQNFGVGPDPNENEEDNYEPPSRAHRRRFSGRRPRPDFRPTADNADKGKARARPDGLTTGASLYMMLRLSNSSDFATYNSYGRPFRRRSRHRKARGFCLLPFIDDFLFMAPSRELALRLRAEIERVWGRLGLVRHPTKAHPEPT